MSNLPFELISLAADLVIFLFVGYYVLRLRIKEKTIDKKEEKIDSNYHHVVDDALAKERQILADATTAADKIILDANANTHASQEEMQKALRDMMQAMQKESLETAAHFLNSYSTSLKTLATTSLTDFQNITKGLEGDMQKQVTEFRETLLPNLEKELEAYKAVRLKQSETIITQIIQKVAQGVLNKSLSMEDHQKILIDALEKAKAEGIFS